MRELKFRAWSKKDKKMYGVDVLNFHGICSLDHAPRHPYSEIEVMQYTGLKDRSGRDIYDGDICKGTNSLGEVEIAVIKYDNLGFSHPAFYKGNIEVIGNIWENPELINNG